MNMQSSALPAEWLALTLSPQTLITSLSPIAELLIGYSPQELIGRPITQVLDDSTSFELLGILDWVREHGFWEGEMIHLSCDGTKFGAWSTLSLLKDNGDHAAGFLLISIPKDSEASGYNNPDLNEVADNLRSLAHDLNNPLAVMMGFTQLIVLNKGCQGKIRADIEKVYAELKRIIQVVERLHGYALSLYGKQSPHEEADIKARTA
jgi:nitrogen-specific signal transduction histidine kinase